MRGGIIGNTCSLRYVMPASLDMSLRERGICNNVVSGNYWGMRVGSNVRNGRPDFLYNTRHSWRKKRFIYVEGHMSDVKSVVNVGELSKPVNTLIVKIANAIGVLYEPNRIKRKAKAEATANEIKAISELKIEDIKSRALVRVIADETKKQENIESIIEKSIPLIEENAKVDDLENDWLANFFEKTKIISDDDMQTLWGKILAGEANKPGSFSRRTLGIIAEFEKKDALLFTNLGKYTFLIGIPTIIIFDVQNEIYLKNGINFNSITHLDSLGLINFNGISGFIRQKLPKRFEITYFGRSLTFQMPNENDNTIQIGNVLLTQPGIELISICGAQPENEIYEYSKQKWIEQGVTLIV
jgi:hypothetical protein